MVQMCNSSKVHVASGLIVATLRDGTEPGMVEPSCHPRPWESEAR